jgi:hypothetical protein
MKRFGETGRPHGFSTQKIAIDSFTVVRTWNIIYLLNLLSLQLRHLSSGTALVLRIQETQGSVLSLFWLKDFLVYLTFSRQCCNNIRSFEKYTPFVVCLMTLFSNLDYIAPNEGMISEWWIGKDLEGSDRVLILMYYPGIFLEGLRKVTKTLSQNSPSALQDMNPRPLKFEAGLLTSRLRRS